MKKEDRDDDFVFNMTMLTTMLTLLTVGMTCYSTSHNNNKSEEIMDGLHNSEQRSLQQEYDEENIRVYPLRSLVPERFVGREAYSPSTGAEEKKFWDSRFRSNGGIR